MLDMLASVAKMGGRVLPNYKLDKSPSLESIELRWSVYGATNAPNQPLSAFVFEKKIIDKYAKQNREAVRCFRWLWRSFISTPPGQQLPLSVFTHQDLCGSCLCGAPTC